MRSKSKARTTLDRINRDIGVSNEIFMDNTPKQTGYNTEMHIVSRLKGMDDCSTETHHLWQNKY